MIIKSMSRKLPSFGQLLDYIDRDAGQEAYTIRHNLAGRKAQSIRAEFERNGELLKKRKNGNYLFHEIISITRAKGLTPEEQKSRLQEIAQEYINARCGDNLVYGGLHQDKDHNRDSLLDAFGHHNLELYVRGKTLGVIDHETGKKHRLKTLDLEMADRVEIRLSGQETEPTKAAEREDAQEQVQEVEFAGQKQKAHDGRQAAEPQRQKQHDHDLQREQNSQAKTPERDEAQERKTSGSSKEKEMLKPEAPQYDSEENLKRREEIEKGERTPDPEMDIMTHEDWRKQDHASHKFAQSWRRTIDDLRGKDRSEEKSRDKGKGRSR